MWNGTSHALEIFRISATNICGQVASSRNPAWGVKKITDILDKKQACGGSVLCCFSPLLCMYSIYIYICKYVSCKHKLLIWYQGPNCWFFIHVLFFSFKINSWETKTIDVSAKNPGSKKIASQNLLPGCLVMKVGWSFLLSWQQSNPLRKGILASRYGTEFQSTSPPWSPLNHHWTISWNY